jgi:hypothetical protein
MGRKYQVARKADLVLVYVAGAHRVKHPVGDRRVDRAHLNIGVFSTFDRHLAHHHKLGRVEFP